MKPPFFSIFIPVYNAEKYINECLDSVFNQTFKDFEIFVHDDNSQDNSYNICEEYSRIHSNMHLSRSFKKESSYVNAQNTFVNKANGKYIIFIDNDDYIDKDCLYKVWKYLSKTSAECAVIAYRYIDVDGKNLPWDEPKLEDGLILSSNEAIKRFLTSYDIEGFRWNKICLKSIYIDNRIEMKDEFPGDIQFVYKILSSVNRIVFIPDKLYHYRQRGDSEVGEFKWENCINFLKCQTEICNKAKEQGLEKEGEFYRISRMIDVVYAIRKKANTISNNQWKELNGYCEELLLNRNIFTIWQSIFKYSKNPIIYWRLYIKAVLCKSLLKHKFKCCVGKI